MQVAFILTSLGLLLFHPSDAKHTYISVSCNYTRRTNRFELTSYVNTSLVAGFYKEPGVRLQRTQMREKSKKAGEDEVEKIYRAIEKKTREPPDNVLYFSSEVRFTPEGNFEIRLANLHVWLPNAHYPERSEPIPDEISDAVAVYAKALYEGVKHLIYYYNEKHIPVMEISVLSATLYVCRLTNVFPVASIKNMIGQFEEKRFEDARLFIRDGKYVAINPFAYQHPPAFGLPVSHALFSTQERAVLCTFKGVKTLLEASFKNQKHNTPLTLLSQNMMTDLNVARRDEYGSLFEEEFAEYNRNWPRCEKKATEVSWRMKLANLPDLPKKINIIPDFMTGLYVVFGVALAVTCLFGLYMYLARFEWFALCLPSITPTIYWGGWGEVKLEVPSENCC